MYHKDIGLSHLYNKNATPKDSSIKDNLLCNHTPSLDDDKQDKH